MNLSANAAKDHNDSYQKEDRKIDGLRRQWIDQPTFIKRIIASLKEKWIQENQYDAIGKGLWKQLKRVSIPIFDGNKRNYNNWKAAFMACIDQDPVTAEYKFSQLRQYLSGEALKAIENLGHSAAADQIVQEKLERTFGGKSRQMAIYLEELENLKPIRFDNSRDLEQFADILDITIVNLKEKWNLWRIGRWFIILDYKRSCQK